MLMSKSRLEKFLYALYSLDSSDLPTPLSRIEELYSCLVTGEEAPIFEPLSRVEKYLMAILGVYDVDSLPNPLSRVEVLLYKLTTGDDNLDDVKSFLSEHEELLAEIIRNGGAGGNIDIEYVLYTLSTGYNTLYNTAEKPVKSAILKGQTLVNDRGNTVSSGDWSTTDSIEYIAKGTNLFLNFECTLLPNTKYLTFFEFDGRGASIQFGTRPANGGWDSVHTVTTDGICKKVVTTGSDSKWLSFIVPNSSSVTDYVKISRIMIIPYQEGMENWDIPYFEGMQSVKMPVLKTTGKNLFDGVLANGGLGDSTGNVVAGNSPLHKHTQNYIKVEPNTDLGIYYESDTFSGATKLYFYDKDKNYLNLNKDVSSSKNASAIVRVPENGDIRYMKMRFFSADSTTEVNPKNIVIAKTSDTITTYEPFKSNILTVNEEVELRGIGNVKDELNLSTGELTQRVGEVVLDGGVDEDFIIDKALTNTLRFYYKTELKGLSGADKFCISDKLPSIEGYSVDKEHISIDGENIWIFINKDKLTSNSVGAVRTYFESNPLTLQYQLATESIKTVDLSVVDQDGNNTKLKTFDDITHVTITSEGPIPEAELEVATKNEEVLSTLSLEMDDISTAQTTLEKTSNTQSENVDATMIATTEIYEGLL